MIRTRITLGSRETPRFVQKDFYDAMKLVITTYQFDSRLYPTSIIYHIPGHFVVERQYNDVDFYDILLDDTVGIPRCRRTTILQKNTFKRRTPGIAFDRFHWTTEDVKHGYYLLTPDAMFHAAEVYTDWSCSSVLYRDVVWNIHFRKVFVDPYDNSNTIWFHTTPRFQVELICNEDFRGKEQELKRAVLAIMPRAFRWE